MDTNKYITTRNLNVQRLAKTLIFSYSLKNDSSQESDKEEQSITSWIHEYLLNPNDKLAESVLPILIEDFEVYLSNNEWRR